MRTFPFPRIAAVALLSACGCTSGAPPPACPKDDPKPPMSAAQNAVAAPFRVLPEDASPVTFDRMAAFPEPGWSIPGAVSFAPDKKSIVYLASENNDREMALFSFDLEKKAPSLLVRAKDLLPAAKPLSREEELRRERVRQQTMGITSYVWAASANAMIIPLGGDLFFRGPDGKSVPLTETREPELDPKLCKNGEKVVFVRGRELFAIDTATKREVALTKGAPEGVTHGQSDFNGQEEFNEQSGFWISPGCDKIAYLEVDERMVGTVPVFGYRDRKPDLMMQRYPHTGEKNPTVKIGILDMASKKTTWVKMPDDKERYVGRFAWAPDGSALFFQSLDRPQKRLTLHRTDPKAGVATEVMAETSPAWIEFSNARLLEKSGALLWTVVRGGHLHLEMRDRSTGKVLSQLTQGDWDVSAIQAVDEEQGFVYFTATKESPLERHLYRVSLKGGDPERMTKERGVHGTIVAPAAGAYVDMHSARDRAPAVIVRDLSGATVGALPIAKDRDIEALKLRPREIVTVKAASGDVMYGALLAPRDMKPGEKHPVVVMVYGGPGAQTVMDRWAPSLLWQHLADRGFVVFQLDNRGAGGRGPAFEHVVYNRLGALELQDQITGVEYLKTLPFVDPSRIGIHGYSYGGFMAALAMFKAPGVFKVGISGAPVTESELYDSGATERLLGTPKENPAGYDGSNLTKMVKGLEGRLLLMHGLMDENVHFQNTANLIEALMAEDKLFDLFVFPGERHGYRSPSARKFANRKVASYFAEHL